MTDYFEMMQQANERFADAYLTKCSYCQALITPQEFENGTADSSGSYYDCKSDRFLPTKVFVHLDCRYDAEQGLR